MMRPVTTLVGGALGGDDEVDAGGAGELRDTADGELDFLATFIMRSASSSMTMTM